MRAPLINPVKAVIYRLDIQTTWAEDPPGDLDTGYDPLLREPIVSRAAATEVRHIERSEMAPVEVPCQVEDQNYDQINMVFGGNAPVTNLVFVFHRQTLEAMSLLDANKTCVLKLGDRIDRIKNRSGSATVMTFVEPLYIYKIMPRSWGFGTTGYDLEIAYTSHRNAMPLGV